MKTTKKQRLENYKKLHPEYYITDVKKMTLLGSTSTFSVLLTTDKGVIMHITKDYNYIVEVGA